MYSPGTGNDIRRFSRWGVILYKLSTLFSWYCRKNDKLLLITEMDCGEKSYLGYFRIIKKH